MWLILTKISAFAIWVQFQVKRKSMLCLEVKTHRSLMPNGIGIE
jgi:hypothetical protein